MKKRYINLDACDKCNGMFFCVNDCVTSFLEIKSGERGEYPSFKERGYCINCGHCNLICPQGAIVYNKDLICDDEFLRFLATKRTVRKYNKERKIPQSILDLIIKAGQSAPSEKNRPTVRIVIIKEQLKSVFEEVLEVLKKHVEKIGSLHPQYKYITELYEKKQPMLWGAEYAVIIIGKDKYCVDAALVAERMQLMAHKHGISSGYNGNVAFAINNSEKLRGKIGLGNFEYALVSFALGYSDIEYHKPYIGVERKVLFL